MTNTEFIQIYHDLIRVRFDFAELATNPNISINQRDISLLDFGELYVPRYGKGNSWDNRPIEQISSDDDSRIMKLKDVIVAPTEWGILIFDDVHRILQNLWPIPLATDGVSGKTLILDSNHTVCTLISSGLVIDVPCVELVGSDLSRLGFDLYRMQQ